MPNDMSAAMAPNQAQQVEGVIRPDPHVSRGETGSFQFHHFPGDPKGFAIIYPDGDISVEHFGEEVNVHALHVIGLTAEAVYLAEPEGAHTVTIHRTEGEPVLLAQWNTKEAALFWVREITEHVGQSWI
jgi:hypothetical protein